MHAKYLSSFSALHMYTMQVIGCSQYMKVSVQLVYEDGTEHGACSLDDSGSRKNALVKEVGPHNNMTAS